GQVARSRTLELSPSLILVAAISARVELKWWTTLPDPRIVRAETSDERGLLRGKTVYRESAELLVSYPSHDSITALRFYSPRWIGHRYQLDLIGEIMFDSERGAANK
ncbi:MAG: hypothetical protein WBD22_05175, partial [Pyrinomonadaceae bacterium]